jgi:BirA family biotin operon repressor/biotin-[acetyl-CoA-carboxylase] ligase
MIGDKKCGGILVESASSPAPDPVHGQQLRYAVIGVGLNLNHSSFPPAIEPVATSLYLHTGKFYDREDVLISLLRWTEEEVTQLLRSWHGTENGATIGERYAAASSWVSGKRVRVGERDSYTGWTRGLDSEGFLRVEDDLGTMRTVLSGGVRPA